MKNEKRAVLKLLLVCSRNKYRSLTAERLFDGMPGYQARSAGTQPGARVVITEGLIGWADVIFFMEKSHRERVREKYPNALEGKEIVTLRVPDDFIYMQTELIEELRAQLEPYVEWPDGM